MAIRCALVGGIAGRKAAAVAVERMETDVVNEIRRSRADCLFVGMATPKHFLGSESPNYARRAIKRGTDG
jgi:hypothetical protein